MSEKEMFQTVMFLIEIERERQEKLAQVRKELALIGIGRREHPKPDPLRVQIY